MAERQFGPYRLVRQIAVGGMAEIHLAKTKGIAGFEKYVALKMIHPNFAEDEAFIGMLIDEAKIAVQLNHGNIAQTFDLGRVGETFYITMEYVDGADLYKILRRSSEQDFEMPLDVCAFIAKEIAIALDHAHRKRDHSGTPLHIVHRDVSPQNVLISYSGEVKLVDFGIAKATMRVRQTAVGVIKGKYYYMSPEQAWGEQIDYRSDIFSAGIVLYEMMTGQMLYLEEDLHKLLLMARNANIAPPSTLRKGVPPQLERIVMHALDRDRSTRYQSAADFAADLERFLHTYSPVFTRAKVANLVKHIVGDPIEVPYGEVAVHEGPKNATHTLTSDDLILDKTELRDENSMLFRLGDLRQKRPTGTPANRVTRHAEIDELIDSQSQPALPPPVARPITPNSGSRAPKPRDANEQTRQVPPAPPGRQEDSGLLDVRLPAESVDATVDATLITGAPRGFGFMTEDSSVDPTVVSAPPLPDESHGDVGHEEPFHDDDEFPGGRTDEDSPTTLRDFRDAAKPKGSAARAPAPPALSANIHAPAVSEIRRPRASRKTPQGGVPAANVLQAIVGANASEAMPTPRLHRRREDSARAPSSSSAAPLPSPPTPGGRTEDSGAMTIPQQPSPVAARPVPPPLSSPPPLGQPAYAQGMPAHDASASYPQYPQYPQQHPGYSSQGYPLSPGGLYQPYGSGRPQHLSVTGQMRLLEADEMSPAYKVTGGPRWIKLVLAGIAAIALAAGVTFFIITVTRETLPTTATVRVESVPSGAEVVLDGTRLTGRTPMPIENVPVGSHHEIRVELPKHKSDVQSIDVPTSGGELSVKAFLTPITGKIKIVSRPDGAEVRLDGQLRGHTPMSIIDLDMAAVKVLELRLKDYQPFVKNLEWPPSGELDVDATLVK